MPLCQKPNEGNGGSNKYYVWNQTLKDVDLHVKIPQGILMNFFFKSLFTIYIKGTRGHSLNVDIEKKKLTVGLKGHDPLFSGSLYAAVNPEESWWTVEVCSPSYIVGLQGNAITVFSTGSKIAHNYLGENQPNGMVAVCCSRPPLN